MKLYLKISLFLAFLMFNYLVSAQNGMLSGRIMDQQQNPIPFATVSVINVPDSTVVTGVVADMDGYFSIKPKFTGTFLLKISSIGFTPVHTEAFNVENSNFQKDFGAITLKEATTMLNEVVLKTWRPTVKVENGKMVMRVEGTALAAGNTAYEMLSRAPGVSTNHNGGFLINGKKGVSVMIDGRLSYLSPKELQSMLQNMPAENIEEIEVIHNPSAKYDAEGTAGILNIKTKKNTMNGFAASVYGGYTYNNLSLYNLGANMSFKKGKWNSYANIDFAKRGYVRTQDSYREFAGNEDVYFSQLGEETSKRYIGNVQLGTDYAINEMHSIGFMANLTYKERENQWNTESLLTNTSAGTATSIDAENFLEDGSSNGRFNLHYEGKLDTLGTTISADLDYVRLQSEADSRFVNSYFFEPQNESLLEELTNNSISDYDIYSAKVDFTFPLSTASGLETGVKASKVISNSKLEFFIKENDDFVFDEDRSDHFRYEEEIYAAYVSYYNKFNETWNLKAGLRAEKTKGLGQSFSTDLRTPVEYLEFFPNLMLEQQVSENYKVNYSYSRRVSRPNYSTLNPFIFYLDPYSYVVGNPFLKPQFTTSVGVTQTLYKKYSLLLSYNFSEDYMAEVPHFDEASRETIFTTRNLKSYKSYTATLVAPLEIASFWNTNNNFILTRDEYKVAMEDQILENENYYFMAQSNHQISLPMDITAEIGATYRGPITYGVYDTGAQFWVDGGLKKSFMDEKLDVSLRFTDIFRGMEQDVTADFLGNYYSLNQYFSQQSVSINLRYNLSNGISSKKTRQETLEEMDRAGA